jgi:hypothetical protein
MKTISIHITRLRNNMLNFLLSRKSKPVNVQKLKIVPKKRKIETIRDEVNVRGYPKVKCHNNFDELKGTVKVQQIEKSTIEVKKIEKGTIEIKKIDKVTIKVQKIENGTIEKKTDRQRSSNEVEFKDVEKSENEFNSKLIRQNETTDDKSNLPWIHKYSDEYLGSRRHIHTLTKAILRRNSLRHSTPIAVMLRGPSGCGKSMVVKQVLQDLKMSSCYFGAGDLDTQKDFEQKFVASVKCNSFKKSVVIVECFDFIQSDVFAKLILLLDGMHCRKTTGKKKPKTPTAGNPIIFIGCNVWSRKFKRLSDYCECINMVGLSSKLLTDILRKVSINEKLPNLIKDCQHIIQASNGDASAMLCQSEFYTSGITTKKDPHAEFDNIFQVLQRMRWPTAGSFESFDFFYGAIMNNKQQIVSGLTTNLEDNRSNIYTMSEFLDSISQTDGKITSNGWTGLNDNYISFIVRDSLMNLPPGRKPDKIKLPKHIDLKYIDILVKGAQANSMTISNLLESVSYMNGFHFQVFDEKYRHDEEKSLAELRVMNHKIQSLKSYK